MGRDRLFWISDFFFCILIIKASCPGTWDPKERGGALQLPSSPALHYRRPGKERTIQVKWSGDRNTKLQNAFGEEETSDSGARKLTVDLPPRQ